MEEGIVRQGFGSETPCYGEQAAIPYTYIRRCGDGPGEKEGLKTEAGKTARGCCSRLELQKDPKAVRKQRPQGHPGKCWHLETGDEGAPDCARAGDPGVPAGHAPVSARKDG